MEHDRPMLTEQQGTAEMQVQVVPGQRSRPASAPPAPGRSVPSTWRPLKVAMIGCRGLPARFGGVERHVEELGARLAALGHDVTVYCRNNYTSERLSEYRLMRLRHLDTADTKHLDALIHSALSSVVAIRDRPDIVHYHALGPGLVAPVTRGLSHAKIVQTVHGLDNQRAKWGRGAKLVLDAGHWMSARVPHATVVVSRALEEHYGGTMGRHAIYVPNGVTAPRHIPAKQIRSRFGLTVGSYVLFVGRLVPEKAPHLLIRAFRHVPGDVRLVIVGDSSFTDDYVTELHDLAAEDPRVLLTGYAFGDMLAELYSNAAVFVLPSDLEGLPLALLEAASYAIPVVASDIAPHAEVLGQSGPGQRMFPRGDEVALASALRDVLAERAPESIGAVRLRDHVLGSYSWDDAALATERLYLGLLGLGDEGELEPASRMLRHRWQKGWR